MAVISRQKRQKTHPLILSGQYKGTEAPQYTKPHADHHTRGPVNSHPVTTTKAGLGSHVKCK